VGRSTDGQPDSRPRRRGPITTLKRSWSAWRGLAMFFRGTRLSILLISLVSILAGLTEALLLALIAAAAAALATGEHEVRLALGQISLDYALVPVLTFGLVLAAGRAVLQLVVAYIPARLGAGATADLRRRLFDAFTAASWQIKAAERDGHFQSLMNAHITAASIAIVSIGAGVSALVVFLTMLVSAFLLSPGAAGALIMLAALLFIVLRPLAGRLRRDANELSIENIEYSKAVQEIVLVAEETEVFGASDSYRDSFYRTIENVRRPLLRTRFLAQATPAAFQSLAFVLLIVALLAIALTGFGPIATLGAIVLILFRALTYGQKVQTAMTTLDERIPFMERLREAVEHYENNPQRTGSSDLPTLRTIVFAEVQHSYVPERRILRGLSFEIAAGEAIGVAGPSGAGKSTLVQLLLRLRDPDSGTLLINGQDARSIRRAEWQRRVAYVPQTPQLIWGTVSDNIRFYRSEITDAMVQEAARAANIHDDIMSWPDGYSTVIGQRASAISGGQRQRLCLARAMAGHPHLLALDEATSALDVKSESLVNESLRRLKGQLTLVAVSHRPSLLSMCDRVLILEGGRVQAFAPPAELAVSSPFYREVLDITDQSGGS
jgi:ATP-binding cassette subfamily B protein